jgi:hypothetical protein
VTALVAILAVAVVLLGVLVVGLLRSHAEILRALHRLGADLDPDQPGPEPRSSLPAPPGGTRSGLGQPVDIVGVDTELQPLSVSVSGPGRLTLLAFLSSSCLTCRSFWDTLGGGEVSVPGGVRVVVVTRGPEAESPADLARLAPPGVVTVLATSAWGIYGVPGSPYFVLVDGDRRTVIGEGTGSSWEQIERLVSSALADAGITADGGRGRGGGPPAPPGQSRDRGPRVDNDLRAAGIGPGHPSLYPGDPAGQEDRP